MKSYKEFINEMLKPISAEVMCKLLNKAGYGDASIYKEQLYDTDIKYIVIKLPKDISELDIYSDNDEKKIYDNYIEDINKFAQTYNWYVNQSRPSAVLLQQRNVNNITTVRTIDAADAMQHGELINNVHDIKSYGFIHVTNAEPNVIAKTGLRAKSSETFDKHDEKRIYMFSLAPQFIVNRKQHAITNLAELVSIRRDNNALLANDIVEFAEARDVEYVYFIKYLQKPAKIYRDDMFDDNKNNDIVYTKDYNIDANAIVYLGTVVQLHKLLDEYKNILDKDDKTGFSHDTKVNDIDYVDSAWTKDRQQQTQNFKKLADATLSSNSAALAIKFINKLIYNKYNIDIDTRKMLMYVCANNTSTNAVAKLLSALPAKIIKIKHKYTDNDVIRAKLRIELATLASIIISTILKFRKFTNNT